MSNTAKAFAKGKAVIPYITAGDPDADSTVRYILAMARAGADMAELGVPFSDPTAESAVVQDSNLRALAAGMTMDGVFDIIRRVREESDIPFVITTYVNPVYFYGYEKFFSLCAELGVGAFASPDLPFDERGEIAEYASRFGVDVVSVIAPTSGDRIPEIAAGAEGFIRVISPLGAVRDEDERDIAALVDEIKKYAKVPVVIGFGVSEPEQARRTAAVCDGVAISSAMVHIIEKYGADAEFAVADLTRRISGAVKQNN